MGIVQAVRRVSRAGAAALDVVCATGGGERLTAEQFAPPGVDAAPLSSDYAMCVRYPASGRFGAVGYVDATRAGIAEPGEVRFYGRDGSGAVQNEIHLKGNGDIVVLNDQCQAVLAGGGTITLSNDGGGSIVLGSSGVVTINGLTIDVSGNVVAPGTVTAAVDVLGGGKSLMLHTHSGVTSGPNNSGPPV